MPRTKKQKIQKRTWDDEDEDIQRYGLVVKNPVLYRLPQNCYDRIILFGDVIIDVNTLIQNQKQYVPKIQVGLVKINKIVKLMKEKLLVFYVETLQQQLTEFYTIINILNSLSSQPAHDLALRIASLQQQTTKALQNTDYSNMDKKKSLVSLQYDPQQMLDKCIELSKQNLDFKDQIFAFNLYTFDQEKMRLNRYLSTAHFGFANILCDDEEELKRRFMSYKINQPQGDLESFIKIQIPLIDKEIVEDMKIYTFDNYIIQSKIIQKCIKLSENSGNVLMLRKYIIDPALLDELKRVREVRRKYMQKLNSSMLLDMSNLSTQSLNDSSSDYEDSLCYNVETFLPKYQPVEC